MTIHFRAFSSLASLNGVLLLRSDRPLLFMMEDTEHCHQKSPILKRKAHAARDTFNKIFMNSILIDDENRRELTLDLG